MMNKDVDKLLSEIEKMRKDLDSMKAYELTMAEQITIIATNTTPAETEPAET